MSKEPTGISEAATTSRRKTVYLIRHAQSMENQRIASMFSCIEDLGRFSLPKKADLGASLELLNVSANADAPISELGRQQCDATKWILVENKFLTTENVELVAHSPLQRAKETCAEVLGCSSDLEEGKDEKKENQTIEDIRGQEIVSYEKDGSSSGSDKSGSTTLTEGTTTTGASGKDDAKLPTPIKRVVNLPLLAEKTPLEWIPGNSGSFEKRVSDLVTWLTDQPESKVCLVGHSQFFKMMLGLPFKFNNCDVYKVTFDPDKTAPNDPVILEHDGTADECVLNPHWYNLVELYSCRERVMTPASEQPVNKATAFAHASDTTKSSL